jgi:hypothetical protein
MQKSLGVPFDVAESAAKAVNRCMFCAVLRYKLSLNTSVFAANLRKNTHDFSLSRYDSHEPNRLLAKLRFEPTRQ